MVLLMLHVMRPTFKAAAAVAAMLAGVERQRTAYRCPWCGQWRLTD